MIVGHDWRTRERQPPITAQGIQDASQDMSGMRPNVPGCVPRCGSTSLNSGTTYLDLGTTSLNSGTTYLDSGTTYLDASQDTSQTSLDASLDPDTVSIPRFYRGGLVEAPRVKASKGGRIQGRGDACRDAATHARDAERLP